jgi:L-gulono-1,4-lactone dehydrogenase
MSERPPSPDMIAHVAHSLSQLKANPASEEALAAARAEMQAHGLAAYFQAAIQTHSIDGGSAQLAAAPATTEALAIGPGDEGQVRQTWTDDIGSRIAQPLKLFRPMTLDELRSILREAAAEGCRVKAVGSGHSFTDVAVTGDFLIDTHGLSQPLDLETDLLRPGVGTNTLFATEAGIVVGDLNEALWNAGLGMVNMGGYDGQTIAGVVSTSTHGSGLAFGPLSSQVVSFTVVAENGTTYRIEPSDGITDPVTWAARHPDVVLKQDDNWFAACQVGIGCLGVVYSVVLRVRPRYFLKEERTLGRWSQVKQDLRDGMVLQANAHYEVLINAYQTNGDHTCIITRRNEVPEPVNPADEPQRNFFVELVASIPGSSDALLTALNLFPQLTPDVIDQAMGAIVGDYVDRSYRVFNIGKANDVPAYGSEIGFTMDRYLAAIERILEIAAQRQQVGQAYLTSPFALRFVKASSAYLSMMHGADTCMVEFPMVDKTIGGKELLQEIETEMYGFGGRPHWGLLNFLSGANGLIEAMYPMLPNWLEVFRQLGPNGTFDNAFTERCGFSPRPFVRV